MHHPQQRLNFLPLPNGQGSFRPTLVERVGRRVSNMEPVRAEGVIANRRSIRCRAARTGRSEGQAAPRAVIW